MLVKTVTCRGSYNLREWTVAMNQTPFHLKNLLTCNSKMFYWLYVLTSNPWSHTDKWCVYETLKKPNVQLTVDVISFVYSVNINIFQVFYDQNTLIKIYRIVWVWVATETFTKQFIFTQNMKYTSVCVTLFKYSLIWFSCLTVTLIKNIKFIW